MTSAGVDVLVVGGGVVGLACGAALARAGRRVVLVERAAGLGRETSSRNSQVIHAGIYDAEGSVKALTCTRGRALLYERCVREGIPHRQTGKWIVATTHDEVTALEELRTRGRANGVEGLDWTTLERLSVAEPDVRAVAALHSAQSGIVDAMALCLSFAAELERHGGAIAQQTTVRTLRPAPHGWWVEASGPDGASTTLPCGAVVNAAGLAADRLAEAAGLDVDASGLRLAPCKGSYFALSPAAPIRPRGLVYPVPAAEGLGIHATVDLAGRVRFGPDAETGDGLDLAVDPTRAAAFAAAASRYLPGLEAAWLTPDQAGLRPRRSGPPGHSRDFVVREESAHGAPGLVDCVGIESPGLTAAPAIAERVVALLASL